MSKTLTGQNSSATLISGNCAILRRPRTALVFLANRITRLLPTSRCFRLKAFLYRSAGYQVSRSCRIISSAQIWGNCRVTIRDETFIRYDALITGGDSHLEVGRFVGIGPRVCIIMGTHIIDMHGPASTGPCVSKDIVIEDGICICANSTNLGGVRLGRKCVIGAGSVVNRDIPPFTMAFGPPCRPVKIWNHEGPGKCGQRPKLMSNIVFWEEMLSPHNSAWIRELAARGEVRVTVVVEREISAHRHALGWTVPDFGRSAVIVCRDLKAAANLITDAGEDAVHVVGGIMRGCPLAARALSELTRRRARVGVISEAPPRAGWRGLVRRIIYQKDRARFGTSIDFLLAMGTKGVDWFAKCGYPARKLFPFAYVTERQSHSTAVPAGSGPAALVYVGGFVACKGLGTLLEALSGLQELDWVLTMIGAGPLEENCRRMVYERGLSERVRFLGVLKNQTARLEIGRSDLLLLPSRDDGWGAVVNEALMEGVPVICSDRCGAADLLREDWRGEVVQAGSVESLRCTLRKWLLRGKRSDCLTERLRNWSQRISGPSVANYFLSIVNHVYRASERPEPPWYTSEISSVR